MVGPKGKINSVGLVVVLVSLSPSSPQMCHRYHLQKFVFLERPSYKKLASLKWCDQATFNTQLTGVNQQIDTVVVPHLVDGALRIKCVNLEDRNKVSAYTEVVTTENFTYYFGFEDKDLNKTVGFLISSWEKSQLITELDLTYQFGHDAVTVFKTGFGSRGGGKINSAGCLNQYFKKHGTGSYRPKPSPACPPEDAHKHQYRRSQYSHDLLHAVIKQHTDVLLDGVERFAHSHNPHLMQLVGDSCSRGILTSGYIPKKTPLQPSKAAQAPSQPGQPPFQPVQPLSQPAQPPSLQPTQPPSQPAQPPPQSAQPLPQSTPLPSQPAQDPPQFAKPSSRVKTRAKQVTKRFNNKKKHFKSGAHPKGLGQGKATSKQRRAFLEVYSDAPALGFINTSHCDPNDKFTKVQRAELLKEASGNGWTYCEKVLEKGNDHLCLPTTCGYQFCFKHPSHQQLTEVRAFFSMEGLGLAMQLEHGIGHHFMGAAFSHHTSIPLCKRGNFVSVTNCNGDFLIVAWGFNGGHREVTERAERRGRVTPRVLREQVASHEATIASQHATIASQHAHIATLEARLREEGKSDGSDNDGCSPL